MKRLRDKPYRGIKAMGTLRMRQLESYAGGCFAGRDTATKGDCIRQPKCRRKHGRSRRSATS